MPINYSMKLVTSLVNLACKLFITYVYGTFLYYSQKYQYAYGQNISTKPHTFNQITWTLDTICIWNRYLLPVISLSMTNMVLLNKNVLLIFMDLMKIIEQYDLWSILLSRRLKRPPSIARFTHLLHYMNRGLTQQQGLNFVYLSIPSAGHDMVSVDTVSSDILASSSARASASAVPVMPQQIPSNL